jgi:hypothetical protein
LHFKARLYRAAKPFIGFQEHHYKKLPHASRTCVKDGSGKPAAQRGLATYSLAEGNAKKHNFLFNRTKSSFNLYLIRLPKRALNLSKIKAKAIDRA